MQNLKILIVDDIEINRLLLSKICNKIDNVYIQEAEDGIEAVKIAFEWRPDIILMDIIMPKLNGIEAIKRIKKEYPNTIVLIISSLVDDIIQEQVGEIGIQAFIHKPFDQNLILFKIMSFALGVQSGQASLSVPSSKNVVNIFNKKVRHFNTLFNIVNSESIMDFGTWLIARIPENGLSVNKLDGLLEFFYQFLSYQIQKSGIFSVTIEEDFDNLYFSFEFQTQQDENDPVFCKVSAFFSEFKVFDRFIYTTLSINACRKTISPEIMTPVVQDVKKLVSVEQNKSIKIDIQKESRQIDTNEKALLHQSFTQKTAAWDYVNDIGGDVLDEIRDLSSLDEEWKNDLRTIEIEPSIAHINGFVTNVLGHYIHAINSMFEFTALGYALSALGVSIKENAEKILEDPSSLKNMLLLMENLGYDLATWREHIFELQDTADIHYLDSSFFSSCIQIEGIISNKEIEMDDDNDFELF